MVCQSPQKPYEESSESLRKNHRASENHSVQSHRTESTYRQQSDDRLKKLKKCGHIKNTQAHTPNTDRTGAFDRARKTLVRAFKVNTFIAQHGPVRCDAAMLHFKRKCARFHYATRSPFAAFRVSEHATTTCAHYTIEYRQKNVSPNIFPPFYALLCLHHDSNSVPL